MDAKTIRYFDMHCDTLSKCVDENKSLIKNDCALDVERLGNFEKAVQFFGCYTNTFDYVGEKAFERMMSQYDIFESSRKQFENYSNVTPILTIENLSPIENDLGRIEQFAKMGFKVASLSWNGYNGIAGGIGCDEGISDFGKEAVKELERNSIVIDVSHLNDRSFFELCDIAEKPFIATHSNSREYCDAPRNLTNDQLKIIFERGGVVGLNLFVNFLGKHTKNKYDDLLIHIDNMYKAGGETKVALGTDFDGCRTDERFGSVNDMPNFYEALNQQLGTACANGIFYNNASSFFEKIL